MKRSSGQAIVEMAIVLALLMPVCILGAAVGYTLWVQGLTVSATQNAAEMLAVNPSADPSDEFTRAGCATFTYTVTQIPGRVQVQSTCQWPSILGGNGETSADRTAVLPAPPPNPDPIAEPSATP